MWHGGGLLGAWEVLPRSLPRATSRIHPPFSPVYLRDRPGLPFKDLFVFSSRTEPRKELCRMSPPALLEGAEGSALLVTPCLDIWSSMSRIRGIPASRRKTGRGGGDIPGKRPLNPL